MLWLATLLGFLVVWVPLLTLFVLVPAYCVWRTWQRVQRTRQPREQPYDYARRKAYEARARERGWVDGMDEIDALT